MKKQSHCVPEDGAFHCRAWTSLQPGCGHFGADPNGGEGCTHYDEAYGTCDSDKANEEAEEEDAC